MEAITKPEAYRVYPGAICGATDGKHRPSSTRMESTGVLMVGHKTICKVCGETITHYFVPEDDTIGFWTPWALSTYSH